MFSNGSPTEETRRPTYGEDWCREVTWVTHDSELETWKIKHLSAEGVNKPVRVYLCFRREDVQSKRYIFGVVEAAKGCWIRDRDAKIIHHWLEKQSCCLHSHQRWPNWWKACRFY